MWSMPLMSPLAIDGAAPSTTTKKIASSLTPNTMSAKGPTRPKASSADP